MCRLVRIKHFRARVWQCQFEDSYIREVRVNYLPTTTIKFRIKGPECVARFVRSVLLDNSREQSIAHNHPSDNVEPSKEDIAITNRLKDAGILLGITLLDHVIVGDSAFASLR